jgi:hypothetical protein
MPSDDRHIPLVPLILGIAGLIPFVTLAVAEAAGWRLLGWSPAFQHAALATYGALIVSFLGGIRWGLAVGMEDQRAARIEYALSVVPQLLAWVSLAAPHPWDLRALAAIVIGLGFLDYTLVVGGKAPTWFGRLRLGLSAGAGFSLLLAGT